MLLFRDELTGWFHNLDKAGHESDRAFYLEAWDGNGSSFTYDRIGRGTIIIANPCISILGGIQPGPLRQYLKAVAAGREADDGLISRFQMFVWPNPPGDWRNVDRWPDTAAKGRSFDIFRAVQALATADLGATADEDGGVPFLRFDPEAQQMFDAWRLDLENAKIRAEGESPMIESHLCKYRSLFPSVALLIHLVNLVGGKVKAGPVPLAAAECAAAWCDFLEAHARRIYGSIGEADKEPARALAGKVRAGDLPSPFAARDVYRRGWTGLGTKEEVDRALSVLEDHGWARSLENRNTGGAAQDRNPRPPQSSRRLGGPMKYLNAFLGREAARTCPTKPTEAISEAGRPPFVGSVGKPPAPSCTENPADPRPDPPSGSSSGPPIVPPYPWRAPLIRWPDSWREAWGRRSNSLEAGGLPWWQAERQAQAEVERAKSSGRLPTGSTVGEILAILDAETRGGRE